MTLSFVLMCVCSYLLGALSGSLIFGRLRGVDIRTQGSGNAGATNALRTQGWRFALAVLLFDVGKGVLAATLIAQWPGVGTAFSPLALGLSCGLAAAIGHCYPVWFGFRGGKGAGTLFGAFVVLTPWCALVALGAWLLCLCTTGYVGLSTMLAALAWGVAVVLVYPGDPVLIGLAVAAVLLIIWAHRSNIRRLLAGNESRFERVRFIHWF